MRRMPASQCAVTHPTHQARARVGAETSRCTAPHPPASSSEPATARRRCEPSTCTRTGARGARRRGMRCAAASPRTSPAHRHHKRDAASTQRTETKRALCRQAAYNARVADETHQGHHGVHRRMHRHAHGAEVRGGQRNESAHDHLHLWHIDTAANVVPRTYNRRLRPIQIKASTRN